MSNKKVRMEVIPEGEEREPRGGLVIKYAAHMHPMTRLTTPDMLDQDRNSMIDILCQILYNALPMMLCYLLNSAFHAPTMFAAVSLGTVISNVLIYYLIENVGIGLSIICSYFTEKDQVGYQYQKALGVSFLICVMMTPVLYFSDRIFAKVFGFDLDERLIEDACIYAWALVPSFYLYSFFDTTKNYLQSEGAIFAPIVISFFCTVLHIFIAYAFIVNLEMGYIGAAWAKNISDCVNSLALYLYIVWKQPTVDSWVEWDIKSANNIYRFLAEVISHEAITYFEAIAFQVVCILACRLPLAETITHFCYSFVFTLIYFCFVSLSQCVNKSISVSVEDYDIFSARKKVSLGLIIVLAFSALFIINILENKEKFFTIFSIGGEVEKEMDKMLYVFLITILFDGVHLVLTGIIKTLTTSEVLKLSLLFFYVVGIGSSSVLCFFFGFGLWGLWVGWLIGVGASLVTSFVKIVGLDWETTFEQLRDRYKTIEEEIRESKIRLTH